MKIIPAEQQRETPAYLGATAGMRLLRYWHCLEPHTSDPFPTTHFCIIAGAEGWDGTGAWWHKGLGVWGAAASGGAMVMGRAPMSAVHQGVQEGLLLCPWGNLPAHSSTSLAAAPEVDEPPLPDLH